MSDDRPVLVTVLAILDSIATVIIFVILLGLLLLANTISSGIPGLPQITAFYLLPVEIAILAIGIIQLLITIGTFEGWHLVWWISIIFAFLGLGASFSFANGLAGMSGEAGGFLLDLAIIIILLLPSSREYFEIGG